ncbi:MAG: M67 family metallopeptidase [Clostridia bacterium]|nr:M67 family metallopeptidase [Clostridia bacterium]
MRITIRQSDFDAMTRYARELAPEEACGLIAGEDQPDGSREIRKVYYLTNTDHTNEHFTIDPREQLAAVRDMRAEGLKPLGNWHSHPETPSRPSEEDQRLANDSGASYLILSLAEPEHPALNAFHIEGTQEAKKVRKEELVILPESRSSGDDQ